MRIKQCTATHNVLYDIHAWYVETSPDFYIVLAIYNCAILYYIILAERNNIIAMIIEQNCNLAAKYHFVVLPYINLD